MVSALLNTLFQMFRWLGRRTVSETILDSTGMHRLRLVERRVWVVDVKNNFIPGYDFHSVQWHSSDGSRWTKELVLSSRDFRRNCPSRRFVSDIAEFEPATGTAILKFGEVDLISEKGVRWCNYSWRRWDLWQNSQIEVIRHCKFPKEKFK